VSSTAPAPLTQAGAGLADGGAGSRRGRRWTYLPVVPFFVFVGIFLILPTGLVLLGALQSDDGTPTLDNVGTVLGDTDFLVAFGRSIQLSLVSALAGAIVGGLFAWAVSAGGPGGKLRQVSISAAGVLAQFGGVMLAFAFLATFGFNGLATIVLMDTVGINLNADPTWVYSMTGLILVYTYFQIPLMVIVFLPALDGLRTEWREASSSLGGSAWSYWRHVGGPILAPSFLGAVLLLFANAFSAYATAAALVSQGSPIVPLQIAETMTSETVQGQANVGKALALGMVVIVVVVMTLYALLQRRASRWVK
jgi:putative spermidine/putrescine transport system permease protein